MRRSPGRGVAAVLVGLVGLGGLGVAGCGGAPAGRGGQGRTCPMDRTVVLAGQDDVDRFAGCTEASGLTIRTGMALDLAPLDRLTRIAGDLTVGPSVGTEELRLLGLREVGGAVRVAANANLRGVFLPRLARAARIEVEGNVALTTLSLPGLQAVAGSLVVADNGDLELVDLAALTEVGGELVVTGNPLLTLLEVDRVQRLGGARIEDNAALDAEIADGLRAKTPPR